ncbi:unnamed protein product [Calypogeia fissa]
MAPAISTELVESLLNASEEADATAIAANAMEEHVDSEDPHSAVNGESSKTTTSSNKKNQKKMQKKKQTGKQKEKQKNMLTQALVDLHFPWTAVNRPEVGRCAIAARSIKAGEVVVAEQAVAFVPRSQSRQMVCHECCGQVYLTEMFECPGCKYSVFCKDCKDEAAQRHKGWCRGFSAVNEIAKASHCDEDLLHLVLELALQHHHISETVGGLENGHSKAGVVKGGIIYPSYEDAICLKTHKDKINAGWKSSVRKGCQLLLDEAVKENGSHKVNFSADALETLAALVNTNSHGMGANGRGIHNTDLAVGIFPFVSVLNHSCRPNCCFASDGRVMYVRAVEDIPKGTELCLSYINLYEPRGVRQRQLAATKYFLCCCQRCSEPFASSIDRYLEGCICTVRGCGGVVVKASSFHELELTSGSFTPASWECDRCSRILDPNTLGGPPKPSSLGEYPWLLVSKAEQKLADALHVYSERRFKDARVLLEQYVDEFTGKLHPLNVLLFDALTPLMNCCRNMGDAAEGSRVCRNILTCMEKVVSGSSLELANFYFCLGEMYLQRSDGPGSNVMKKHNRKLAQENFQHVRDIRKICLGEASLPE